MKVLLIRPAPEEETIGLQHVMICEPLELEYLCSAVAEHDVQVRIVDMILEKRPLSEILGDFRPDLVGVTGYITHVGVIKKLAKSIKHIHPCRIAVGGVHAEVVPEDFKSKHIDYIVHANGIETFRQLVDTLKKNEDTSGIEGLWRKNGVRPEAVLQIDRLLPDRTAVKAYRKHYYYMFHNPCALVKTAIGCNYRCRFCFCHKITGGVSRRRSPEHVVEELSTICEREIYMVDDNFLHNRKWLEAFISLLKKKKIRKKYLVYGRADFVSENRDLIKAFHDVGLRAVIVGLESFSTDELKAYNKKSSRSINESAVRVLRKNGIECYGTFITGIDWRAMDFFRLFLWISRLGLIFVNLQPFTPYPGTDIYEAYQDKLCVTRDAYRKWDLAHLVLAPEHVSARGYYALIFVMYYLITMNPVSVLKMIRRYGLKPTLKLGIGSSRITGQYIRKIINPYR